MGVLSSSRRALWHCAFPLLLLVVCSTAYSQLSDDTLRSLPKPGSDFDIHEGKILSPILQTRVPGTPGSTAVLNHFASFFRTALPDWTLEFQNSTARTPVSGDKEVPFVNFIAYRDPPWAAQGDSGRLTLVAHYDSKLQPEGFIGAIDSAAPCAMIMHAMRSIDSALTAKWNEIDAQGHAGLDIDENTGIQVLFLDGEEAFKDWTATDSLYGSRSLAEHWEQAYYPAMSPFRTQLSSITLFVLLDLLGSKSPTIRSYFPTTHWAYQNMARLETRLRELRQFKSAPDNGEGGGGCTIQDDHLPFLRRGVEVLHLIDFHTGKGFPDVWHTMDDDAEHLDIPTVEDWATLVTAFAAEWMDLEGYFQPAPSAAAALYSRKTEL
ncbi:putative glutaminyl cyclase [Talaromyces proteolyticus]|uniref:Peptide hydrolase n=1 Tax=Talaromyces proteolyticus TaxID=1131652 RepID=A0AAD4KL83_9EURO|nr:putative glutaminyl cyclase [Talaromyces proteolyticus]KAH8693859.1 putative glutaminyl cyclase [Talaromyces proteolyticus]